VTPQSPICDNERMHRATHAASPRREDPPSPSYRPIERRAAPSRDDFADFVRRGRPVVLTGLLDGWKARAWSLETIDRAFGACSAMKLGTRDGVLDVDERQTAEFRPIRVSEQIAAMRRGDCASYLSVPLDRMPPSFHQGISTLPYCEGARHLRGRFWLGPAGTVTPLHHDLPHNLSAQLFGRKRWLLYPPTESVYRCAPWSRAPNFARVDPERPDVARFPRFASARPLGCVLSPGEVLFIPRLWWHHVRSLDDNAAINFWFGGPVIEALVQAAELFKRARSLYPGEWE
jgi:hypothetical protein